MRISVKGLALASGILWGGSILIVGVFNLIFPEYGRAFLEICSSLYPGFDNTGSVLDIIVGTVYGLVDGIVCGGVFAWIYNYFTET